MVRRLLPALLAAIPALVLAAGGSNGEDLHRAVVRISTHAQRGDWAVPWNRAPVEGRTGSGFVLAGGRIMTNAHVVGDARLILVHLHRDPTPYPAVIRHVAHDADLALLELRDPGVLADLPGLALAPTPGLGATVDTLGYPSGSRQVTSTRGVVSRIDAQLYVHSGSHVHLAVQTDAAINPGSSGGPVVHAGKVVGVAFQGNSSLENVGFFIPHEVVTRFLRDVEDGSYEGYPSLGIGVANLENPAIRSWLGMAPGESGVRVFRVTPGAAAHGHLEVGDVLLDVAGTPVANDGTVASPEGRIPFSLLVDRLLVGERLRLRILRDGARRDLEFPLGGRPPPLERGLRYDVRPRYLIHAGLVFAPVDRDLLATWGSGWASSAPAETLDAFVLRPLRDPSRARDEVVVLVRVLEHPVNARMAWSSGEVIESLNGAPVRGLGDLARALDAATGDHLVFELAHDGRLLVLNRAAARAAHPEILARYGVPRDRRMDEEAP